MSITKERIIIAAFTVASLFLLTGCEDRPAPNTVHSPQDVPGKLIGAIEGSPSVILAEELGVSKGFPTGVDLMYNLKTGVLDCVIMENSVATELVADTSGVRILSEPLREYELSFAVAKENAQLIRAVNTALTALREDGTLGKLLDKYSAGKKYEYISPGDAGQRPGSLSVAVSPDSPPYSYKNEDDEFMGLDVDVARAVCDYLGVDLVIVEFETRELVTAVWYGKADMALGWVPVEGEDKIAISDAYANTVHVVIVRR